MKSKRIVSIDILKIMCIIMVVILHLTSYGVKDISIKFLSIPYWFIACLLYTSRCVYETAVMGAGRGSRIFTNALQNFVLPDLHAS